MPTLASNSSAINSTATRSASARSIATYSFSEPASLVANNLSCKRGQQQLFRNINFSLEAGQMLFLQGENGSGKTTLLRSLCGLSRLVVGRIQWCGKPLSELEAKDWQQWLYLGHKDGLKEEFSPLENLLHWQGLRGEKPDEEAALKALHAAGLAGKEFLLVRYLSQGQKRRAALARLLAKPPRMWVLDEPLAALDVSSTQWLSEVIQRHLQAGGMVIATSHQPFSSILQPLELNLSALANADADVMQTGAKHV